MGGGVLMYFGYPQAQEDHAERAVRAGLELLTDVGTAVTYHPLGGDHFLLITKSGFLLSGRSRQR